MLKTVVAIAALLIILLMPLGIAHAQVGDPGKAPLLIAPQVAPTVAAWTSSGKILLVVDTISGLQRSQWKDVTPDPGLMVGADLSTPEGVAAANGYQAVWFGKVMAVAPATTTVLHTDSDLFKLPLSRLIAAHPLTFLLCSLTPAQFSLLSTNGLGIADLTADQQSLFQAINPFSLNLIASDINYPDGPDYDPGSSPTALVDLQKKYKEEQEGYDRQIVKLPTDQIIGQLRLHAYLNQTYSLSSIDSFEEGMSEDSQFNYSTGPMKVAMDIHDEPANAPAKVDLKSLLVSQEPNYAKPSDMNWKAPFFTAPVYVTNLKSVDQMVDVLAKATHLELYADTSYGGESVYIAGDLKATQTAGSLMQALALCVSGTWRKVGPAYVLTNDLAGFGARQQFINDVVSSWSIRMGKVVGDLSGTFAKFNWQNTLSNFPSDTEELSASDAAKFCTKNGNMDGTIHWSDVPAALQTNFLKQLADSNSDSSADDASKSAAPAITIKPDEKVDLSLDAELAWELPGDGIMSFRQLDLHSDKRDDTPTVDRSSVTSAVSSATVHAVICAPKTMDEALKTVDLLPELGMNTLIVDVFNNGRTYFPTSAIASESNDAAGVLKAAIAEAAVKHIAVYAAVDLLCWRKDGDAKTPAPWLSKVQPNVNVFGEASDVGYRRMLQADEVDQIYLHDNDDFLRDNAQGESWVSPFDPSVRSSLPKIIDNLARIPGLSGLVFQNTAGPGYLASTSFVPPGLGYTLDNRLSFLRQAHVDPIDVAVNNAAFLHSDTKANTDMTLIRLRIPGFHSTNSQIDPWRKFKQDADLSLLNACFEAVKNADPVLPLLIRDQESGMTLDVWKDPGVVSFASKNSDQPFSYIDNSTIMDIPVMKFLRQDAPLPAAIANFCAANSNGKEGGIALDIEDGAIDDYVPGLLKRLKLLLGSQNQK